MLSEAWMDQLEFQAQWVAADLFPNDTIVVSRRPGLDSLVMYRVSSEGLSDHVATLTLGSVGFREGCNPNGLQKIASWDEIVSYCNSLVGEQ